MYTLPTANVGNLAVSPDGALIYVALTDSDMITMLDANLLVGHQPPLITNIGAFRAPYQVSVSPVVHSQRDSHVGAVAEH